MVFYRSRTKDDTNFWYPKDRNGVFKVKCEHGVSSCAGPLIRLSS